VNLFSPQNQSEVGVNLFSPKLSGGVNIFSPTISETSKAKANFWSTISDDDLPEGI